MKNKLIVPKDQTAYQQWKSEGKSDWGFVKLTLSLLVLIPAFVYVTATVADPFMHHPISGFLATVGIFYAGKKFVEACDARF